MSSVATVMIDEVDVTGFAVEGSSTRWLNRPSTAQVRLPMKHAIGGAGSLLKIYFDGVLHHHGRVLLCETQCDENTGYTVYNSTDPLEMWKWRPVRDPGTGFTSSCTTVAPVDDPGDFSGPTIIQDFVTGPEIVEAMMYASQNIALGADDAEGSLFLANGSFACGGVAMIGAPTDWPMTMADLASLLVSTGEVDIVITPIELDGDGNYGQIDVYNGNYGDDLSSSVAFQYGMGAFNIRALRWTEDMTNLVNKLWYFLGPQIDQQHWPANVTGTSDFAGDCGADGTGVIARIGTGAGSPGDSRGDFGVRMNIQVFDADGAAALGYCLYQRLWLIEAWLRALPQQMVHITPTRDSEIGSFDIGDLVLVEATGAVRGGFSGAQRVYGYTISWDAQDSVPALGELQVSADQEGFAT